MSNYKVIVTGLSAPTRPWSCLVLIGITFSPPPPYQYSLSAVCLLKGGQV